MEQEYQKDDNIKIGEKDFHFYIGECVMALRKHDQINLTANDAYLEKMLYVVSALDSVGVLLDDLSKSKLGKVQVVKEVLHDYHNKRTGRISDLSLNKIYLTKIPELFKFTKLK